jgi:predicted RND superfamily exporter protein
MSRARNTNYSGLKTADGKLKTGAAMVAAERRQVTTNQAEARKIIADDDVKDQKEHYDRRILVDNDFIQAASDAKDESKLAVMSEEKRAKTVLMAEEHKNALKRTDQYVKSYIGRDDIVNEAYKLDEASDGAKTEYKDIISGKGVINSTATDVSTLKNHQKKVARILSLHKIIKDSASSGDYKSAKSAAMQLKAIVGDDGDSDSGLEIIIGSTNTRSRDAWRAEITDYYRAGKVGEMIETNLNTQPTDAFKLRQNVPTP